MPNSYSLAKGGSTCGVIARSSQDTPTPSHHLVPQVIPRVISQLLALPSSWYSDSDADTPFQGPAHRQLFYHLRELLA